MPKSNLPKSKPTQNAATDEDDELAVRLVALFNDDQVLLKMKKTLYPQDIVDKLDALSKKVESLGKQLKCKDEKIDELERKVNDLEIQSDRHEQYTRRSNLRIQGLPETANITDGMVLQLINETMNMTPPIVINDIERSHYLGPATDNDGKPRKRAIIVRFKSERIRDQVFRARTTLKTHNNDHREGRIFINEDLTARRASLAYVTRQLKKSGKINDSWTHDGKILIKDLNNKIVQIISESDLGKY